MLFIKTAVALAISRSGAQNEKSRRPFDNGRSFEVKLAVPGKPGNDYPILNEIPRTSFSCSGREPGYYADMETNCQVFRVCTFGSTYGYQSFLCPNGTLFNQAVYVCDWWMNVNCSKSKELYKYKSELSSLRIVPHFMRDIKKMITHPMRNPYDNLIDKNNLIVIQDYKPPNIELYNALSKNHAQRNYSEISFQAKETHQNVYSPNIITNMTSTPKAYYFSNFNIYPPTNKTVNIFQQQSQRSFPQQKLVNKPRTPQAQFSNGHSALQSLPKKISSYTKNIKDTESSQFNHKGQEFFNYQHAQYPYQKERLVFKKKPLLANHSKLQLSQHIEHDKELYSSKSNQLRYSKDIKKQVDKETKQNSVSNDTSPTLIRKTLAFREIIKDPKNGSPKSKITFKTWIIRPPKSEKLSVDSSPYIYNTPKNAIDGVTYNSDLNTIPFINTTSEESIDHDKASLKPYEYNPPASAQIFIPTTEPPLISESSIEFSEATKPSLLYLPAKSIEILPNLNDIPTDIIETQRQYLLPNNILSPLTALGSSPVPFMQSPIKTNDNESIFSLSKQPLSKPNHNNLVLSDTRVKNHLDTTVNELLKDTRKLFETVSSDNIYGFKQEIQTIDYPDDHYSPQNFNHEKLLLQPPSLLLKKSKLVATPSVVLEPPIESYEYSNENANRLSYLSFIQQPMNKLNNFPTIERTVSIKITIPEEIADLIFKKNISDNLEILNTENTNHFVLANKMSNKNEPQYIPIGQIIWNKSSDISPSQDLVFSFLADTINAAQKHNNNAHQHITSQPISAHSKYHYMNDNGIEAISNKISQMTLAQFSNIKASSNDQKPRKLTQSHSNNDFVHKKYTQMKTENAGFHNKKRTHQDLKHSQQNTNKHRNTDLKLPNGEIIYSGQLYKLPVPEVTKQFYNIPSQTNAKYSSSNEWLQNKQKENYIIETNYKQPQPEYEIIKSHILPTETYRITSKQTQESLDQRNIANNFIPHIHKDSITAQIHDNTIGTFPHPLNKDKYINYKKDQTYYIYSHPISENNTENNNRDKSNTVKSKFISKPNSKLSDLIYQIIPSIGYEVKSDNTKQTALNILQNDETKHFLNDGDQRQEVGVDFNYVIDHPESRKTINSYKGPSSYNAPRAVVGNLKLEQNIQTDFNENVEKIENYGENGYPKVIPAKRFTF